MPKVTSVAANVTEEHGDAMLTLDAKGAQADHLHRESGWGCEPLGRLAGAGTTGTTTTPAWLAVPNPSIEIKQRREEASVHGGKNGNLTEQRYTSQERNDEAEIVLIGGYCGSGKSI